MTLVLGFSCRDGIVIASDTKVSDGMTQEIQTKLFFEKQGKKFSAIGASASSDQSTTRAIENKILAAVARQEGDVGQLVADLVAATTDFADMSLLCITDKANNWLYLLDRNYLVEVREPSIAIGSGSSIAKYWLPFLYPAPRLCNDAFLTSLFVLNESARTAEGVGPPFQVVKIDLKGNMETYDAAQTSDYLSFVA